MPVLIGTSRKSFLGKLLNEAPADERLNATIATLVAAVLHGAHIIRVHDVKSTVEALKIADALRRIS
jgi:dihydropteroate synthase